MNWIRCSEKLPEYYKTVLVTDGYRVDSAYLRENSSAEIWCCSVTGNYVDNVTHWAEIIFPEK